MNKKIIDEMKNEAWLLKLKNVNTSTMEKPTDFVHYNDVRTLFRCLHKNGNQKFLWVHETKRKIVVKFLKIAVQTKRIIIVQWKVNEEAIQKKVEY